MEATFHRLWKISKAARDSGIALQCRVSALNLTFDEIEELGGFDVRLQVGMYLMVLLPPVSNPAVVLPNGSVSIVRYTCRGK